MQFRHLFIPRDDEKVLAQLWPHPFIFLQIFVSYLFILLVPVLVYLVLNYVSPSILKGVIALELLSVICFTFYLAVLMVAFSIWVDTYLDFWTITDKRIISREQKGLFNRVVSELELYRVQDVSVEQKGFFATTLNYGDLYIQSAGEQERFVFKNVGEPIKISRIIQRLDLDAKKEQFKQSQIKPE